ncbi:hypothetical protein [Streptosporangium sp. KLBMP 9127]|nr:hypothetical protein [Streptosporangium sp. KLBMP 9127]
MTAKIRFDLKWHGGLAKTRERAATARGLHNAAEHLLDKAVEVTPIEHLGLVETGTATSDAAQLRAAVSFDGEYAVVQHEDLELDHDAGKTSKYLEAPFHAEQDEMRRIIAAELGQELR